MSYNFIVDSIYLMYYFFVNKIVSYDWCIFEVGIYFLNSVEI